MDNLEILFLASFSGPAANPWQFHAVEGSSEIFDAAGVLQQDDGSYSAFTRFSIVSSYWVLSTSWAQRAAHSSENCRVLLVLNYNRVITIRFIEPIQTNYNFGYSCCSCRSFAFSLKSYLPIDPMVVFVPPSNILHAFILITKQPVIHKHAGQHSAEYSQIHHSRYPTFHVPNHI